jgi:hypothetical protein
MNSEGACHLIPGNSMLFAGGGQTSSTRDWCGSSSGTFGTKIVTVDRFSPNNWLDNLRAGTTFWQVRTTAWPDYYTLQLHPALTYYSRRGLPLPLLVVPRMRWSQAFEPTCIARWRCQTGVWRPQTRGPSPGLACSTLAPASEVEVWCTTDAPGLRDNRLKVGL